MVFAPIWTGLSHCRVALFRATMACTALVVRPPSGGRTPAPKDILRRLRRQELASRRACFWDTATRRASCWSRVWEWPCSPHVMLFTSRTHSISHPFSPSHNISPYDSLATSQVIELGEDLLKLIGLDRATTLALASTCRCLRGLLLPRLTAFKDRAVRDVYLSL